MRRADLVGEIVGMAAASRCECNDARYALRILAGKSQRAPGAGLMSDNDGAILPDEGLPAQIAERRCDRLSRGAPGADIVGFVANTLRFAIPPPLCSPYAPRRSRHAPGVPAPARQTPAPPAMPPARGIPAAAFARDATGFALRRAQSRQAGTALRRAGETAKRAPRCPDRARGPAIAAYGQVRLRRLARRLGVGAAPC